MSTNVMMGRMRSVAASRTLAAAIVFGLLGGCSDAGSAVEDPASSASSDVATSAPEATTETPAQPATVADLFPPAEEKEMVLNSCATCHAVACAAIGQRSAARWEALAGGHREHVPNLADSDRQRIFAYLAANFNETRPEPTVPAEFMDRGCTPF